MGKQTSGKNIAVLHCCEHHGRWPCFTVHADYTLQCTCAASLPQSAVIQRPSTVTVMIT